MIQKYYGSQKLILRPTRQLSEHSVCWGQLFQESFRIEIMQTSFSLYLLANFLNNKNVTSFVGGSLSGSNPLYKMLTGAIHMLRLQVVTFAFCNPQLLLHPLVCHSFFLVNRVYKSILNGMSSIRNLY